jgi:4-hydroxymandelate oxidase
VETLLTLDDAERLAEEATTPEAWSYIVGGAGDERTLRWNREAFSRYRLRPRVLVDVSSVTTETTVLGTCVDARAGGADGVPQGLTRRRARGGEGRRCGRR